MGLASPEWVVRNCLRDPNQDLRNHSVGRHLRSRVLGKTPFESERPVVAGRTLFWHDEGILMLSAGDWKPDGL